MQKTRRQLSIEIVRCDGFVDMSAEAQALYLQLVMSCDDEGFTASTNVCKAFAHAGDKAEKELVDKEFILQIKANNRKVTVIKHWRMNNYFREGQAKESTFAERAQVYVKPNGNYTLDPSEGQPLAPNEQTSLSKRQQPLSKKQGSLSNEQTPLSKKRQPLSKKQGSMKNPRDGTPAHSDALAGPQGAPRSNSIQGTNVPNSIQSNTKGLGQGRVPTREGDDDDDKPF